MNILAVYNEEGNLIFTQTNANDKYSCLVEEVADDKEVIGVDLETKTFILADRLATNQEKEDLKRELEIRNKELLEANTTIETINNQLDDSNTRLQETTTQLEETSATLTATTTQLDEVNSKLEETTTTLAETSATLTAQQNENEHLVDTVIELQAQSLIIDSTTSEEE